MVTVDAWRAGNASIKPLHRRVLAEADLTWPQFVLLWHVSEQAVTTTDEAAAWIGVDPSCVVLAAARLSRRGMVYLPSPRGDVPAIAAATPRGRDLVSVLWLGVAALQAVLLCPLTRMHLEAVVAALSAMPALGEPIGHGTPRRAATNGSADAP